MSHEESYISISLLFTDYLREISMQHVLIFAALFFSFSTNILAQWVNNPSSNTRVTIDCAQPRSISAVEDGQGGGFVFWEDKKSNLNREVYFQHFDANGRISFRADGKAVSTNGGDKINPVGANFSNNSAAVLWNDYSSSSLGELFAQRVSNSGNLLWGSGGVKLTVRREEPIDYSLAVDKKEFSYIGYVLKGADFPIDYKLIFQKLNSSGEPLFRLEGITIYKSLSRNSFIKVIADNKGGAYILWIETNANKSLLYCQYVDSNGVLPWGKKPLLISSNSYSTVNFTAELLSSTSIYTAWQGQKITKDIYHQIITAKGKTLLPAGGKLVTTAKGNHSYPQSLIENSTIILTWISEQNGDKNIYLQKFKADGKALPGENGAHVIVSPGGQFGQRLIPDGTGGSIIAWIDNRSDKKNSLIYSQRIDETGKPVWTPNGIPMASYNNSEKSYLSLISDGKGGAIAVFKDGRNKEYEIYAQKIFNNGAYVSQIIGFNAQTIGDSIKLSWYSANELKGTRFEIERSVQSDSIYFNWETLNYLTSNTGSSNNFYEVFDKPDIGGTIYYRLLQTDGEGNSQESEVARVNYIIESDKIILSQNNPNPFSDSTMITFFLPENQEASIEFFNSRVEKISEIASKEYSAGKNRVIFHAGSLPGGIYFYRFKSKKFVDVKKMVITKKG